MPNNQWCPAEIDADTLLGIRGFESYGVVEYQNSKMYLSLDFFAGKEGAKLSGHYGKSGMSGVSDVAVAIDMLATCENLPQQELADIEQRLRKHAQGPHTIASSKNKRTIIIRNLEEKRSYRVWPTEGDGSKDRSFKIGSAERLP